MASKSKGRGASSQPKPRQAAATSTQPPPDVKVLVDESADAASEFEVDPAVIETSGTDGVTPDDLRAAAQLFNAAADIARKRSAEHSEKTQELNRRGAEVEQAKADLVAQRKALGEEQKKLKADRVKLDKRQEKLLADELALEARTSAQVAEAYQRIHAEVLDPLVEARAALVSESGAKLVEQMKQLAERDSELLQQRAELESQFAKLSVEKRAVERDREEWDREQAEELDDTIAELRQQLDRERRRSDRFRDNVAELQRLEVELADIRSATGDDPRQLMVLNRSLQDQVRRLTEDLAARPDATVSAARDYLEDRVQQLAKQVLALQADNDSLQSDLLASQMAVYERDRLQRERDALLAATAAYQDRLDGLAADYERLVNRGSDKPPFPECSAMDARPGLQVRPSPMLEGMVDLGGLVDYLQHALVNRPSGPRLFFGKDDLRLFIAGMAMSRLHILEGVSGTGKTSLPTAVVSALGGTAAKIEVQAGWRDNRDLLGYYNEFEKHFREHEFTRALYQALTPRHADGIFFVVLDEMNLSKPEYYFADLLSILEDREGADPDRMAGVPLSDQTIRPLPDRLVEPERGGVELPLGDNVWFIGTANHDETTSSFAPKTQSRAHVMELPRRPPALDNLVAPSGPFAWGRALNHADLLRAFDTACDRHKKDAELAEDFLRSTLDVLEEFDEELSWGPRIDRQIRRFVPALVAAGGSVGLGVDHLLYTKLTRKLRDGFIVGVKAARQSLLTHIERDWPDPQLSLDRSKAIADLRRQLSRQ